MSITTIVSGIKLIGTLAGQPDTINIEQVEKIEFSKNNIEYHETGNPETRKARLNLFYELPGNTKAYSFIEMDKTGYFARTMANTPINKKGTGVKTEMKNSNKFKDHLGIGIEQKFKVAGVNTAIKALPLWTNIEGYMNNTVVVGVSVSKQWGNIHILNKEFQVQISTFAELNVAAKKGPKWGYGEINAEIQIPTKAGQFDLGAGYDLYGKEKLMPDTQFRVKIGYHIKK